MNKSHPFLLLVVTICLLLVALMAFWFAMMPQRMLRQLTEGMARENGITLEAKNPKLRFNNGLALQLDAVAMTGAGEHPSSVTAQAVRMDIGFSALFGGSPTVQAVWLNVAVVELDIAAKSKLLLLPANTINIREGTVKLRDPARQGVIAVTDVNGEILRTDAGGAKLDVSFVQNGSLTTLVAEVENIERLLGAGGPADISLSSKDRLVSFSGRARLSSGLALDGQMTLEAPDVASALTWLGMPLQLMQGVGVMSLQAGLSTDGMLANFAAAKLRMGENAFTGSGQLMAGPDRPKLTAALDANEVKLWPALVGSPVFSHPWNEAAYAVTDLTALDADVALKMQSLAMRGTALGAADIKIAVSGGKAALTARLAPSQLSAHLAVERRVEALAVDVTLDGKAVDNGIVLSALAGLDNLAGTGDVSIKVSSEGKSLASLVSALKGTLSFSSTKAQLAGVDLAALMAMRGEGWQSAEGLNTPDMAMAVDATLDDGIATLGKAEITIDGVTLKPKGELDLLRQAFAISLHPKGKGMDPKLALKGTWLSPVFASDTGPVPALRPSAAAGKAPAVAPPTAN